MSLPQDVEERLYCSSFKAEKKKKNSRLHLQTYPSIHSSKKEKTSSPQKISPSSKKKTEKRSEATSSSAWDRTRNLPVAMRYVCVIAG
jgi:hypothetical protein